jgi:hypothetical protein
MPISPQPVNKLFVLEAILQIIPSRSRLPKTTGGSQKAHKKHKCDSPGFCAGNELFNTYKE